MDLAKLPGYILIFAIQHNMQLWTDTIAPAFLKSCIFVLKLKKKKQLNH